MRGPAATCRPLPSHASCLLPCLLLQTLGVTVQLLKLVLFAQLASVFGNSSNISPLWQVRRRWHAPVVAHRLVCILCAPAAPALTLPACLPLLRCR